MQEQSKERVRDSAPELNYLMRVVNEYKLLENGTLTQEELDKYLDRELYSPMTDEERMTRFKICKADDPTTTLDQIE